MIYLRRCCCFVDLRFGTILISLVHIFLDAIGLFFIGAWGESSRPDLAHKLFLIFLMIHILSCVCLVIGSLRLKSGWMIFYLVTTWVMAMAMIILFITDIILRLGYLVLVIYVGMFLFCIYFWLVVYSFYAALGGALFI
ncbi:hypothetical protein KR009_005452 [Drosophila setifemur]|nr:hypothetical protein KR009_005452 [Drosophila setifemur]